MSSTKLMALTALEDSASKDDIKSSDIDKTAKKVEISSASSEGISVYKSECLPLSSKSSSAESAHDLDMGDNMSIFISPVNSETDALASPRLEPAVVKPNRYEQLDESEKYQEPTITEKESPGKIITEDRKSDEEDEIYHTQTLANVTKKSYGDVVRNSVKTSVGNISSKETNNGKEGEINDSNVVRKSVKSSTNNVLEEANNGKEDRIGRLRKLDKKTESNHGTTVRKSVKSSIGNIISEEKNNDEENEIDNKNSTRKSVKSSPQSIILEEINNGQEDESEERKSVKSSVSTISEGDSTEVKKSLHDRTILSRLETAIEEIGNKLEIIQDALKVLKPKPNVQSDEEKRSTKEELSTCTATSKGEKDNNVTRWLETDEASSSTVSKQQRRHSSLEDEKASQIKERLSSTQKSPASVLNKKTSSQQKQRDHSKTGSTAFKSNTSLKQKGREPSKSGNISQAKVEKISNVYNDSYRRESFQNRLRARLRETEDCSRLQGSSELNSANQMNSLSQRVCLDENFQNSRCKVCYIVIACFLATMLFLFYNV